MSVSGPKHFDFIVSVSPPGLADPPHATVWLGHVVLWFGNVPWHSGPDAMREAYDYAISQVALALKRVLEEPT